MISEHLSRHIEVHVYFDGVSSLSPLVERIYLFSDPVEDDVRELLTGYVNEAVEDLCSWDDGD